MHLVQLIAIQYNGRNARLSIALPLTTHHAPIAHCTICSGCAKCVGMHVWALTGTCCTGTYNRPYNRPYSRPLNQPTCTLARRHARWTGRDMSGVSRAGGSSSVAQAEQYYILTVRCCILLPLLPRHNKDMTQISDHAAAPNRWPVPLCLFPMAAPSYPSAGQGSLWCVHMYLANGTVRWICLCPSPSLSSIMMIGDDRTLFFFYGACRQCRTVASWDGGKKKKK